MIRHGIKQTEPLIMQKQHILAVSYRRVETAALVADSPAFSNRFSPAKDEYATASRLASAGAH